MAAETYPEMTPELARKRRELAPDIQAAFDAFGRQVFADGAERIQFPTASRPNQPP